MPDEAATTEQEFEEFHRRNPAVFDVLRRLSFEAVENGHRRIGIDLLFARYRWERPSETGEGEDFKIRNDFKPYYARRLMVEVPNLRGLFAIKRLSVPEPAWAADLWDDEPDPRERRADREGAPIPGQEALPL